VTIDGLSYDGLNVVAGQKLVSNNVFPPATDDTAQAAQFASMLPDGLVRIQINAPTDSAGGDFFPPWFHFVPNAPHERAAEGAFAQVRSAEPIVDVCQVVNPSGSFHFYPFRESETGANIIGAGPSSAHRTRLLWETNLPAGTGLMLNDGRAWSGNANAKFSDGQTAKTGTAYRAAAYLFRTATNTLILGKASYLSGTGPFDFAINPNGESQPFTTVDVMRMYVEMWRDAGTGAQHFQVTQLDGTVILPDTIDGLNMPRGGTIGGIMANVSVPTRIFHKIWLDQMWAS
jgi:hypothetical protein